MKKIQIDIDVDVLSPDGKPLIAKPLNYGQQLRDLIADGRNGASSQQEGLNIDDMRKRIKIIEKIDDARKAKKKFLLLEDAEHELVSGIVKNIKWLVAHVAFVDFTDAMVNAEEAKDDAAKVKNSSK